MKSLVLAVAAALSAGSAFAADLPTRPYTKAPPVIAAAYDWSGFYIGGNGGGAWSSKCWDIDPFSIFNPAGFADPIDFWAIARCPGEIPFVGRGASAVEKTCLGEQSAAPVHTDIAM